MGLAVIGVGANLGLRENTIKAAAVLLRCADGIEVIDMSPLYETEPVGPPQPTYLNAAFRVETSLTMRALLRRIIDIERALGRTRDPDVRWGPRVIDLDILWAAKPVDEPGLKVPHPRLTERAFALAPLLDVAPELAEDYQHALNQVGGPPPKWLSDAPRTVTIEEA